LITAYAIVHDHDKAYKYWKDVEISNYNLMDIVFLSMRVARGFTGEAPIGKEINDKYHDLFLRMHAGDINLL
jgi:hypothetical protein